jgi:hypothetical protein
VTAKVDWIRREPGMRDVRKELYRLGKRAVRRPIATLSIAIVLTTAVVAVRARKQPRYEATLVLAITEGGEDITKKDAPRPPAQLKAYMSDVALSSARLTKVIEEQHLYPSLFRRDPKKAVESMREDLDVQVYNNYFLLERAPDDPPRSARIALSYAAGSQHVAQTVVHALGQLVVEEEATSRQEATARAARAAADGVEAARNELYDRRASMSRMELSLVHASPDDATTLRVQLAEEDNSMRAAQTRLDEATREENELELRARLEARDLGLRFQVAEEELEVTGLPLGKKKLALLILAVFTFALPLAAMFVGAFDARVRDLDDVRRLGLTGLGHVPSFKGDRVGALADRARD